MAFRNLRRTTWSGSSECCYTRAHGAGYRRAHNGSDCGLAVAGLHDSYTQGMLARRRFEFTYHPFIPEFRALVPGVVQPGAFAFGSSTRADGAPRIRARVAVGRRFLLWNVLVVDLSNDSLRAHQRVAGLSAFSAAYHLRCAFSRSCLRTDCACHQSIWKLGDHRRAADLGFD